MLQNYSLIDQKEAQEAVGRALLSVLPDGAESIVLRMGVLEPVMSGTIKATFPDGSTKGLRLGNRFDDDLVDRMRKVMYRAGSGTWFSVEMTVTAEGSMSAKFNYDDEPDLGTTLDPVSYVYDAKAFPRYEEHQPEWLKQRLVEGQARTSGQS